MDVASSMCFGASLPPVVQTLKVSCNNVLVRENIKVYQPEVSVLHSLSFFSCVPHIKLMPH